MEALPLTPIVFSVIGSVVGLLAYIYTTFATIKYVQEKHDEMKTLVTEIREWTKLVDERLWEIKSKLK
jgi:hypothetical protein